MVVHTGKPVIRQQIQRGYGSKQIERRPGIIAQKQGHVRPDFRRNDRVRMRPVQRGVHVGLAEAGTQQFAGFFRGQTIISQVPIANRKHINGTLYANAASLALVNGLLALD